MNQIVDYFIVGFIHPKLNKVIYIASNNDIQKICSNIDLQLSYTLDQNYAKRYLNIQDAKNDIYNLRYYRREYLNVKNIIIKISENMSENNLNENNPIVYYDIDSYENFTAADE